MVNRIDWRLKTLIGFLQYTLFILAMNLPFIPNSCFSGGENGAHFARTLEDVGKRRGKWGKEQSLNPYQEKGLAIAFDFGSYPEPIHNPIKQRKIRDTKRNRTTLSTGSYKAPPFSLNIF